MLPFLHFITLQSTLIASKFKTLRTTLEALYTGNGIITQMNISGMYTVQFIIRLVPADVMAMFLHRPTAVADNSQPTFPL
jgi:hypothetical protein